ncbi:MAG TPA: twin-arginine translocase TatA/TatE family subunit [Rubrobacteraceae bacterium]|nr:twin-arginine translocase TatA/TatE family subunit [Rubrobacteraceae bacterium]
MGFGIGFQEVLVIAVLFLILFGPSKLPQMARDLGKFVNEARRSMEEFKSEIVAADEDDEETVKRRR